MLPYPQDSMQSADDVEKVARLGRVGRPTRAAIFVAAAVWLSCSSPEAFRGKGGLTSTDASGAAGGLGQAGTPGVDASGGGGSIIAAASPTGAGGDDAGAAGTPGTGGVADAGGPAAGAGGSSAGGSSAAGASGTGAGGVVDAGSPTGAAGTPPMQLALPFDVSDHYAPTGFMGDGIVAGSITMTTALTVCAGEPAAAMTGTCYGVTYQPQPIVAPAPSTWGGVYWQFPDNNWGTVQPQTIASGAKDISFFAKGKVGGESVTFQAGGIINAVSAATPYTDSFMVNETYILTTTWTKYTLSMTGQAYAGGVLGGFAWVATANNANPITFYVHGIVWE